MLDYTVENQDIAISEEAADEQEAFDAATILAEEYRGREFYIHLHGKPYAVVWWRDGRMHVKDIYRPVTAALRALDKSQPIPPYAMSTIKRIADDTSLAYRSIKGHKPRTLRASGPSNDLMYYVWAVAQYLTGNPRFLDLSALRRLDQGIEDLTGVRPNIAASETTRDTVLSWFNDLAKSVVKRLGMEEKLDQHHPLAQRWVPNSSIKRDLHG